MDTSDRRVRRTRRLLGEALLELIQEQSFDAITIRDITERADVGYATFFRHYDGKEALLSEQLEQIVRRLETLSGERSDDYFEREGRLFFEHVQGNAHLYRGLLGDHVQSRIVRRLRDTLVGIVLPHMEGHAEGADLRIPLAVAANHVAASALELAAWWLENEMPYDPQEMGRIYRRLIIEATWQAILPPEAGDELHKAGLASR